MKRVEERSAPLGRGKSWSSIWAGEMLGGWSGGRTWVSKRSRGRERFRGRCLWICWHLSRTVSARRPRDEGTLVPHSGSGSAPAEPQGTHHGRTYYIFPRWSHLVELTWQKDKMTSGTSSHLFEKCPFRHIFHINLGRNARYHFAAISSEPHITNSCRNEEGSAVVKRSRPVGSGKNCAMPTPTAIETPRWVADG